MINTYSMDDSVDGFLTMNSCIDIYYGFIANIYIVLTYICDRASENQPSWHKKFP